MLASDQRVLMPGTHSNNIAAPPTGQPAGIAVLEEVLPREISLEGGIEETVSELPTMGKLGVASEDTGLVREPPGSSPQC